jgi:hypothetical protein
LVLSEEHPRHIRYRSHEPVLTPESPQERRGAVADVVFPTGIDRRDDLGSPDRFDVYYGMADDRIGVARLDLPGACRQGPSPTARNTRSNVVGRRPAGPLGGQFAPRLDRLARVLSDLRTPPSDRMIRHKLF